MSNYTLLISKLDQLISIISRMAPPVFKPIDTEKTDCFVWESQDLSVNPIERVNRIDLSLIVGIDNIRDILVDNTRRFSKNLPANNILLWGARGMGKSSLVKAAHAFVNQERSHSKPLKLIEVYRDDINTMPLLMNELRRNEYNFILFCDDLSFDYEDTSYKYLKTVLDGSLEGQPENVLFYATSNRRHLIARNMIANERSTAVNPLEAIEEKISLSDRFGLCLGFYPCSQNDYLKMVKNYARHHNLDIESEKLCSDALEWAITRGSRSGRVAWQFIQDLAGRLSESSHKTDGLF